MVTDQEPLEYLAAADPDIAGRLEAALAASPSAYTDREIRFLVDEILSGFVQELSFGQAYARGITALVRLAGPGHLARYCSLVDTAGRHGPALGKLFADALVQVVAHDPGRFTDRFLQVTDIMLAKGAHTLKDPLDTLSRLLAAKDAASARHYLELLAEVYGRPLTYNRCQRISKRLPRLAAALPGPRRPRQLAALRKVMAVDDILMEPFFDGLDKEAGLLDENALTFFVRRGLEAFVRDRAHGIRFFELASLPGLETCRALQVAVPLSAVRGRLDRYLQARVGKGLNVTSFEALAAAYGRPTGDDCIWFDGGTLYFKDVLNRLPSRQANTDLYMCLARLESACAEFGTFDFDLERAVDFKEIEMDGRKPPGNLTDLERFFALFDRPDLAAGLFTLVEHGRLRCRLAARYPGLDRLARDMVGREAARQVAAGCQPIFFYELYARLALGMRGGLPGDVGGDDNVVAGIERLFEERMTPEATAETSAGIVQRIYPLVAALADDSPDAPAAYGKWPWPFGRRIRPALYGLRFHRDLALADRIKRRMDRSGFKLYRADLMKLLKERGGRVAADDLASIVVSGAPKNGDPADRPALAADTVLLADLLPEPGLEDQKEAAGAHVFRYPEWDSTQNDYLMDYTRLAEKKLSGHENGFYRQVLQQHRGLVKRIRNAFELLKPVGIQILRQWIEGDDFDYRALLDFALDKKAGTTPSERLYIKRMKSARDVAVMLLVDLSKSTSNPVLGSTATVLDVEKEAIVLFCEALEVVGDTYAVSGFSGTGRLGVDFFTLKGFGEGMGSPVRSRINAMTPQRNTRMGTAIRHAAHSFGDIDTAIKLLIVLGDGYPNDTGYKKRYAIEDTRKAIFEARSRGIFTHGITVNIGTDHEMDDLYGPVHHTVISDVRELPDKLWRIYSSLTR